MLVIAVVPCSAQTPADTSLTSILRHAASRSWQLQLTTSSAAHRGRMLRVSQDTVQLVGRRVPLQSVIRVERQLKQGGGAVAGGVIGGVTLGAFGLLLSGLCDQQDCTRAHIGGAMIGAGLGGTLGALMGAMIHPPTVSWQHLWGTEH